MKGSILETPREKFYIKKRYRLCRWPVSDSLLVNVIHKNHCKKLIYAGLLKKDTITDISQRILCLFFRTVIFLNICERMSHYQNIFKYFKYVTFLWIDTIKAWIKKRKELWLFTAYGTNTLQVLFIAFNKRNEKWIVL